MKNSFYFVLDKYLVSGSSMLATFMLANALGPEKYSELAFAFTIISAISVFTFYCNDQQLQVDMIKNGDMANSILYSSTLVRVLVSCCLVILISILVNITDVISKEIYIAISFYLLFFSFDQLRSHFIANNNPNDLVKYTVPAIIISALLKFFLIYQSSSEIELSFIYLLDPLLLSIAFVIYFYSKIKDDDDVLIFDLKYILSLHIRCFPLFISAIIVMLHNTIDHYVVRAYMDKVDYANYNLMMKFVGVYILMSSVFNLSKIKIIVNQSTSNLGASSSSNAIIELFRETLIFAIFSTTLYLLITPIIFTKYFSDFNVPFMYFMYSCPLIFFSFFQSSISRLLIIFGLSNDLLFRNASSLVVLVVLIAIMINIERISIELISVILSFCVFYNCCLFLIFRPKLIGIVRMMFK